MVVLNERVADSQLSEQIAPEDLLEETALFAMHDRLQQHGTFEARGQ